MKANELIRLLYGDEADGLIQPDDRLRRWAVAFDSWLEERITRFSQNVGPDSHKAWAEFLAFTRKAPWDIRVEEVEAYIEALKGKGLSAGTIHKRLTGLSKFYEHCQENGIDAQCPAGMSRSGSCGINSDKLGTGFNPAAEARRPKVKMYEKTNYLSLEEEKALLEAIKNDPSVTGKRDYALFSLLLATGCRAREARCLRWRDVEFEGGRAWANFGAGPSTTLRTGPSTSLRTGPSTTLRTGPSTTLRTGPSTTPSLKLRVRSGQGWGAGRRVELPREVWEAMRDYLEAAGRMGAIQAGEYVFAPSKEALVREAGGKAEDWAGERPLSMDQLHYLVKLYAGWAGLRAEEITCHTLRHTAVRRWIEAGMGADEVQKKLGRVSAGKTEEYIERLNYKSSIPQRTIKKVGTDLQAPQRGPCRTKPRNHLALKHGLRAKYLPELESMEEQGIQLRGLERELVRWRVVVRRATILSREAETLKEGLQLLEAGGTAAVRVGKVLKYMHESKEARMKAPQQVRGKLSWEAVDKAIEEVLKERGYL